MTNKLASRISKVCRYTDRSVLALLSIIFLTLLGYGISLLESTGQISSQGERITLITVPLCTAMFGIAGSFVGQSNRLRRFVTGALVGLLTVSWTIAIGDLGMTDSLGKPLPSMLLPAAGAAVMLGLLADLVALVTRHIPLKAVPTAG